MKRVCSSLLTYHENEAKLLSSIARQTLDSLESCLLSRGGILPWERHTGADASGLHSSCHPGANRDAEVAAMRGSTLGGHLAVRDHLGCCGNHLGDLDGASVAGSDGQSSRPPRSHSCSDSSVQLRRGCHGVHSCRSSAAYRRCCGLDQLCYLRSAGQAGCCSCGCCGKLHDPSSRSQVGCSHDQPQNLWPIFHGSLAWWPEEEPAQCRACFGCVVDSDLLASTQAQLTLSADFGQVQQPWDDLHCAGACGETCLHLPDQWHWSVLATASLTSLAFLAAQTCQPCETGVSVVTWM